MNTVLVLVPTCHYTCTGQLLAAEYSKSDSAITTITNRHHRHDHDKGYMDYVRLMEIRCQLNYAVLLYILRVNMRFHQTPQTCNMIPLPSRHQK
jgi:hypothetical protein